MKTSKLIIYNILALVTSFNILYLYLGGGIREFAIEREYLYFILQPAFLIIVLFLSALFVNLSYIVASAKARKNLLKISLILITLLTLSSIIIRIVQATSGVFVLSLYVNTLLYIMLFILNIFILKDLFMLIRRLFNKEQQKRFN